MPRTTGSKNLPKSVQREIALDALRGVPTSEIASENGITEDGVRRLRRKAERDPEAAVEEAREELAFRLEVVEMLRGEV